MAPRAKQVVPFPTTQINRSIEAKRHPDSVSLALTLQTTLNIKAQLQILFNEISGSVAIEGASYAHKELEMNYRVGETSRHSCSYSLDLMGDNLGTLVFNHSSRFTKEQLETIEYLLSAALYPLNNAIKYKRALNLARRDPLTGIANRISMTETLEREVNRAQRYESPLSILMIDLDHFKAVNDNYGHSTGDVVLKEAVRCIKQGLRLSDQPFRFGGEEFVVLLTNTNLEASQIVAERIRNCMESSAVINNEFTIRFTTSIGIAELESQDSEQSLFDHADKALYQAKSEGRNRVVCWKD